MIHKLVHDGRVSVLLRDFSSNGTLVNKFVLGFNQFTELKDGDEILITESARFVFRSSNPNRRTFARLYTLMEPLGKGHAGEVFACQEDSTGQRFAVKRYTANKGSPLEEEKIVAELHLMGLRHRNIIFMKEIFYEDESNLHVMQIAEKGNLFDLVLRKSRIPENETRTIFTQLLDAVKYLVSVPESSIDGPRSLTN